MIDRRQNLQSAPLALFPEQHGLLHRVFLTLKPSTLNRLTNKRFLVGGELHFHTSLAYESAKHVSSSQGATNVKVVSIPGLDISDKIFGISESTLFGHPFLLLSGWITSQC